MKTVFFVQLLSLTTAFNTFNVQRKTISSLRAIDVSGLPIDMTAISPDTILKSANLQDTTSAIQNALILAFGVGYLIAEKRPRGFCRDELVDVRKSSIPKANLGVFATAFIPKGTSVGEYPGFVMNPEEALKRKLNDNARTSAKRYMWALQDDVVLDPTNKEGLLELEIPYVFGLYKVDTTMARVNEPGPGSDCNIITKVTVDKVEFVAERDIFAGEELYLDYGNFYDRSGYNTELEDQMKKRVVDAARRKQEDEEMLTLQPVTLDEDNIFSGNEIKRKKKVVVDQDTSMSDGFLSKLKKKEGDRLEQAGILAPEDAADMFASLGSGMFSQTEEDKEFLAE
jgi:hypothetical protein